MREDISKSIDQEKIEKIEDPYLGHQNSISKRFASSGDCESLQHLSLPNKDIETSVSCNYGGSKRVVHKNGSYRDLSGINDNENIYRDLKLVGFGPRGKGCGNIVPKKICSNIQCSKVHYGVYKCGKKKCPECWEKWRAAEVDKIRARLLCDESKQKHKGKRLVHIIVSPLGPEKLITRKEFESLIKDGYRYLKSKGVLGGVVVIHPFRGTGYAKKLAKNNNMKTWEWIRNSECTWNWYKIGLHFHVIAFIDWIKPPEEGEEWIYKVITSQGNKPRDLLPRGKNIYQIQRLSNYLLSHTVISEAEGLFQTIRWFGTCGNNKLKLSDEEKLELKFYEKKEYFCTLCQAPLQDVWIWIGLFYYDICRGAIPPPDSMDEIEAIVHGEWELSDGYREQMIDI